MSVRLFYDLFDELNNGNRAALAILVKKTGSAPRDVGAKMLITEDGRILGTLGGGCVEAEVFETGRQAIAKDSFLLKKFSLSHDLAAAEGLVCGGTIWVAVIPLGQRHRQFIENLLEATKQPGEIRFCLSLRPPGSQLGPESSLYTMFLKSPEESISHAVSDKHRETDSHLPGPTGQLSTISDETLNTATPSLCATKTTWLYHEALSPTPDLIIFGCGHISLHLARMAANLGFRITVVDDRPYFADPKRFPEADRVVVSEFETAWGNLSPGSSTYVIIVTRGHKHDDTVLRQTLLKDHEYIGMIGSRHKVKQIVKKLLDDGIREEKLLRLYSPIGLDIGAETPAEIAVSIMAEIIALRSRGFDPKRTYTHMRKV
ncbi:MAG: XdhC/CoxI family protein [bacterium]|nr:XdhC/CoxI family protein [bacterium]